VDIMAAPDRRKFQVRCDAGGPGRFEVGTDALSVRVRQRMGAAKDQEMWDSVQILCKEQPDGSLTVEVFVCHPRLGRKVTADVFRFEFVVCFPTSRIPSSRPCQTLAFSENHQEILTRLRSAQGLTWSSLCAYL